MIAAQQVVEAVKAVLTGATDAGTRVYSDRLWPLDEDKLPAWRVFVEDEEITAATIHWPQLRDHALTLVVQGSVQAVSGADAALQALRAQGCTALLAAAGPVVLGLPVSILEERSATLSMSEGHDRQLAQIDMRMRICFQTYANAPESLV